MGNNYNDIKAATPVIINLHKDADGKPGANAEIDFRLDPKDPSVGSPLISDQAQNAYLFQPKPGAPVEYGEITRHTYFKDDPKPIHDANRVLEMAGKACGVTPVQTQLLVGGEEVKDPKAGHQIIDGRIKDFCAHLPKPLTP